MRGRICIQHAQDVETRGGWQILTDSRAQPHCILTADAPPSPEDRFLGGGRGCIGGGGEESKEGKKEGDRRMNEAEGEFHEYGYERLRPLSARHNVKTISKGFLEIEASVDHKRQRSLSD